MFFLFLMSNFKKLQERGYYFKNTYNICFSTLKITLWLIQLFFRNARLFFATISSSTSSSTTTATVTTTSICFTSNAAITACSGKRRKRNLSTYDEQNFIPSRVQRLFLLIRRKSKDILSKSANRRKVKVHPRPVIGWKILQI